MLPDNGKQKFMAIIATLGFICFVSCNNKKKSTVSPVEFNDPWIIICPMTDPNIGHSALLSAYLDRKDTNILYLAEVMGKGESLRIDLTTKQVSPYKFNVKKWEDIDNFADRFKLGFNMESIRGHDESRPIRSEFHGNIVTRTVSHMYGYPVANKPGTIISKFGTGTWVLIDNFEKKDRELVRYQISNFKTDDWGFDSMDSFVSPDGKWVMYRLPLGMEPVFIFRRGQQSSTPNRWVTFQPDWGAFNAKLGVFKDRQ